MAEVKGRREMGGNTVCVCSGSVRCGGWYWAGYCCCCCECEEEAPAGEAAPHTPPPVHQDNKRAASGQHAEDAWA